MKKNNNDMQPTRTTRLCDLCFVYAKLKWMRSFKAFDVNECYFVGNLIHATLIEDCEENHRKLQQLADMNKTGCLQLQLRRNGIVVFETQQAA